MPKMHSGLSDLNSHPPCTCYTRMPPGSTWEELGVDVTNGRYGDVSVATCSACGRRWLNYSAEFEGFRASGRLIRGILPSDQAVPFPPEEAIPNFNRMRWFYYQLCGDPLRCGKGDAPADLTGSYPEPAVIDNAAETSNGLPASDPYKVNEGGSGASRPA